MLGCLSVEVIYKYFDRFLQRMQVIPHDAIYEFYINIEITMSNMITHAHDVLPWYIGAYFLQ